MTPVEYEDPGSVVVEGAFDPAANFYFEWSASFTPGFDDWRREMISRGYEVHSMTIDEMLAWIDANPAH
jgi:hypothetical protein